MNGMRIRFDGAGSSVFVVRSLFCVAFVHFLGDPFVCISRRMCVCVIYFRTTNYICITAGVSICYNGNVYAFQCERRQSNRVSMQKKHVYSTPTAARRRATAGNRARMYQFTFHGNSMALTAYRMKCENRKRKMIKSKENDDDADDEK